MEGFPFCPYCLLSACRIFCAVAVWSAWLLPPSISYSPKRSPRHIFSTECFFLDAFPPVHFSSYQMHCCVFCPRSLIGRSIPTDLVFSPLVVASTRQVRRRGKGGPGYSAGFSWDPSRRLTEAAFSWVESWEGGGETGETLVNKTSLLQKDGARLCREGGKGTDFLAPPFSHSFFTMFTFSGFFSPLASPTQ